MRCIVPNCNKSQHINWNLSYHRFPIDERLSKWIQACQLQNVLAEHSKTYFRSKRVCSLHFLANDFRESGRLRYDAVPSVFGKQHLLFQENSTECMTDVNVSNEQLHFIRCLPIEDINKNCDESTGTDSFVNDASSVKNELESLNMSPTQAVDIEDTKVIIEHPIQSLIIPVSAHDKSTQTPRGFCSVSCLQKKLTLRRSVNRLRKQNIRLKNKQAQNEQISLQRLDTITRSEFLYVAQRFLPNETVSFLELQMGLNINSRGNRYPTELKQFALMLYSLSPEAYDYLSEIFCLPSKTVLDREIPDV